MDRAVVPFVRRHLLISLGALPVVLLAGVFARELTRITAQGLSADALQEATLLVLLGHGHAFVLLCIVPALFAGAASFAGPHIPAASLRWLSVSSGLYLAGSLVTVLLILYRGFFHLALLGSTASINPGDAALFGGSALLRAVAYGLVHLMMGVGLVWTGIILAKAVARRR